MTLNPGYGKHQQSIKRTLTPVLEMIPRGFPMQPRSRTNVWMALHCLPNYVQTCRYLRLSTILMVYNSFYSPASYHPLIHFLSHRWNGLFTVLQHTSFCFLSLTLLVLSFQLLIVIPTGSYLKKIATHQLELISTTKYSKQVSLIKTNWCNPSLLWIFMQ